MQTIEVETINADFGFVFLVVVPTAEPANQVQKIGVAPHPARKAFEFVEGHESARVGRLAANVAMDAKNVGPICFQRDDIEAFFLDEAFGDLGAGFVELMRPVSGFAEQNES